MISGEPPTDLDARGKVGLEGGNRQADESYEGGHTPDLDGPEAEAVAVEVGLDAGGERSLSPRPSSFGRNSITAGSAFKAAKGDRGRIRATCGDRGGRS